MFLSLHSVQFAHSYKLACFSALYGTTLYLPLYTASRGFHITTTMTLLQFTIAVSNIGLGFLSDLVSVGLLISTSCFISGVATFTLWEMHPNEIVLMVFTCLCELKHSYPPPPKKKMQEICQIMHCLLMNQSPVGLSSGGFSSMLNKFARIIVQEDQKSVQNMYGFFIATRGVVSLINGPVAGSLITTDNSGAKDFQPLIIYCGVLMCICTVGVLFKAFHIPQTKADSQVEHV